MRLRLSFLALLFGMLPARVGIHAELVEYNQGHAVCEGSLAHDDSMGARRTMPRPIFAHGRQ
jgi:hypothetical protein